MLEGDSLIELKDSAKLGSGAFTVSLWFNPYEPAGAQQVLAGKNRYSRNERQWSLTIEPNGRLQAHLKQDGWSTISCGETLKAGGWHWAVLVVEPDKAALFLNGKQAGEVKLKRPVAPTDSPITLGGIWDEGGVRQAFHGAVDECSVIARALTQEEIFANYKPVENTHEIATQATPVGLPLWDTAQVLPKAAELPQVEGARFHVIKNQRPDEEGCKWTLGVGLAWHKGKLYASYGYNIGDENTATEEAHVRVSSDNGVSWGRPVVMDAGEGNLGVSHGVFLSHGDNLWAFMGAFYDRFQRTHTRAYRLNETTGSWEAHGMVIPDGFWPMQEPQRMTDGNWIMAGARISNGYGVKGDLPAVAISKGDDFTRWEMVVIDPAQGAGKIWGESTVILEGKRILNISRYGRKALALISVSEDYGRTWTPSAPSNLPMATSKPYSGTLSTGQRYLVCTTTADTGGSRSPLTIAVSKPGESLLSKVFLVRRSVCDETPGVSHPKADFSYPYAVEHDGKLYIGYTHKSHAANELAVIPVASLSTAALHAAEPVFIDLAKRTWQGIPGLERTAKGRIFVSWFTGGTKEPEPENTVVLSQSDDGGKTFSAPQAMGLPLNDGTRCYDPCLWVDPKGRLWYLFNRSVKDSTKHGVYARICDAPDAPKPVWGAEFRIGFDSPFSFRMNKPTVLSSGEWVLPVVHALEPLAGWAGFDPKQVFGAAISTDEGKTWSLHGDVRTPKAGLENMIVELKDGRLWMLIRTEKLLWECHSSDKGRTWTEGKPSTIATPHSRFFIRRLSSGNLLLVNHYKFTGRSHLTAQLSTDDGATWNEGLLLDERSGVSYPDGVQEKDGLILITYDRDRGGAGEILLAKFKEEDVLAGKNVSSCVSLRQVINRLNKPPVKVTQ
jgi:predicted neuraminidase